MTNVGLAKIKVARLTDMLLPNKLKPTIQELEEEF